jgi:putative solute:sodium symporter small subunit
MKEAGLYSARFGYPVRMFFATRREIARAEEKPRIGSHDVRSSTLEEDSAMQLTQSQQAYWQKNLRITAFLLSIWFLVTFVLTFYARDLTFNFFGWPFSFYMAAQGSLIIYVIIIWYYARYMNRLDREFDVQEGEDD